MTRWQARICRSLLALPMAVGLVAAVVPALGHADPNTCKQGYVWREARDGDVVCVTPDMRRTIKRQNVDPTVNHVPGDIMCVSGFVWREAFDGDTICVTPAFRSTVLGDNAAAPSRVVGDAPASGPGGGGNHHVTMGVDTFNTVQLGSVQAVPGNGMEEWHSTSPWSREFDIGPDTTYLSMQGWAAHKVRCYITVDGAVVAQQEGSVVWCKWGKR